MADIDLPNVGESNWGPKLNTAVEAVNTEVESVANVASAAVPNTPEGRQALAGSTELSTAIGDVVGPAVAPKLDTAVAAATYPTIVHAGVSGFPSIVFLGDSNFQIGSTPSARQYGESVPQVTCWQSNGRLVFAENAGVASDTVQMMRDRLQADVISKHPAACVILAGSNSTTKGQAHWDDARSVYENEIIKPLMAAGILPVLCTIPPRDGSRTVGTGGTYGVNGPLIYRLTLAWNVFVRAMAAKYRLPLVDLYAVVTDPATGEYRTPGWTSDGVHWNTSRTHEIGKAIVDVLAPLFPNVVVPLTRDRQLVGGNPTLNWAPDGLFLGAFDQGTGGRYPLGFNGTSSSNLTVAAVDPVAGDPLTAGKWMQLSKIGGTSSYNVNLVRTLNQIQTNTGIALVAGQRVGIGFAYKLENILSNAYLTVSFTWRDSGAASLRMTTPMNQFKVASKGIVYFEDVVPTGAADCRLDFAWGADGTGDFYVGQVTEVNLDGNGIPSLKTAA